MAANNFQAGGGGLWSSTLSWSLGAVPTAADGNVATFTGASPNCDTTGANRVCNGIDFSAYTNTITMTNQITVSGAVTLGASMGVAGSGKIIADSTATLTSNGFIWPNAFDFGTAGDTLTFADAWTVAGTVTLGTSTTGATLNGFSLTAQGSVTDGATSGTVTGTTKLVMTGTGTYTPASTTGILGLDFEINAPGQTVTIANGTNFRYSTGTAKITAGTLVTTNVALFLSGTITAFNFGGTYTTGSITWNNVTGSIGADLTFTGLLTLGPTSGTQTINGTANLNCQAGLSLTTTSGNITGAGITVNLTGTGTFSASALTTGRFSLALNINAPGGTITNTSLLYIDLHLVNYIAGTVTTTAGTWATSGPAVPSWTIALQ